MAEKIRPTKAQTRHLFNCHVGVGVIMVHTAENEVVTIDFYTSCDGVLRRPADAQPIFPLDLHDDIPGSATQINPQVRQERDWLRQAYFDLCAEQGIDMPCNEYDPAGDGAGVEVDGEPQCADCGHPRLMHDRQ